MSLAERSDVSTALYRSAHAEFGQFRCPPSHQRWRTTNSIGDAPTIAFPRVPVRIDQCGRDAFIADPSCVVLYNSGQTYARRALSERGDECEFVRIDPGLIEDALSDTGYVPERTPERPFEASTAPCPPRIYMLQRRLHARLTGDEVGDDALGCEEMFYSLVEEALRLAWAGRGQRRRRGMRAGTLRAHQELVENAKRVLLANWAENISVEVVARAAHSTPFHLCRVFKAMTGYTMHAYLRAVRLAAALEQLGEFPENLSRLARGTGFSSHAHFTEAFADAFGITPARARKEWRR